MTLGEFIRKYREEHDNMSYRAFANLVGLSPQYVINLEKGLNNDGKAVSPSYETYKKIAKGTGIQELDFLKMVDDSVVVNPKTASSDKLNLLSELLKDLTDSEADQLLSMIKEIKRGR